MNRNTLEGRDKHEAFLIAQVWLIVDMWRTYA